MHDLPTRSPDATTRTPPRAQAASPLQIHVSHDDQGCAVRLGGELDMATSGQLRDVLQLVRASGPDLVVVDMGELRFFSLAGLYVLAEAQRSLQAVGSRMVLGNPSTLARRVLAITGLAQVLT